jgi:hypothetical protein
MVSRIDVGMSDSEIRATLQYLQEQITAFEAMNTPTPLPTVDKILYYRNGVAALAWLSIGANLEITDGVISATATGGGGGSTSWNALTSVPTIIDIIDGLTPAADKFIVFSSGAAGAMQTVSSAGLALIDDVDAAAMLVTLGAQTSDATLTALAGVSTSANKVIYATGSDAFSTTDFTAYGRSVVGVADEAAFKALVNLEIGTDVQAYDAELLQIAGLAAPGADRVLFWDHSALSYAYLSMGTNISISGTTLNVSSGTATLGDGDYGDIVATSSGTVLTIDAGVVTLAKMANIATASFIGRTTGGTGVPEALTVTQATAMLNVFGPDSGSGGVKGLVPATASGDATKVLSGAGTWVAQTSGGDALVANPLSQFASTTSAQLATVLSNETGSGFVVFSDSPLFSGTPTFPNTGLHILDTNGTHDLIIVPGSNLTADHSFTITTGDNDRILDVSAASVTISAFGATILDDADASAVLTTIGAQPLDADLTALAALSTTGMLARTASNTYVPRTITGTSGEITVTNGDGVSGVPTLSLDADIKTRMIPFNFRGGGATLVVGTKGRVYVNFNCTITEVTMGADQSGSIVIDIWKDTHANYPPTIADTITASAKPTISSTTKSQDATLTGWTKTIAAGSWLVFNIDSVTSIQELDGYLTVTTT